MSTEVDERGLTLLDLTLDFPLDLAGLHPLINGLGAPNYEELKPVEKPQPLTVPVSRSVCYEVDTISQKLREMNDRLAELDTGGHRCSRGFQPQVMWPQILMQRPPKSCHVACDLGPFHAHRQPPNS